MKKSILILLTLMLAGAPVLAMDEMDRDGIETEMAGITLNVTGSSVRVTGAQGEVMEVFNLTGAKVATIKIESADKSFNLNLSKGCYLLKVGKIVRKISIR